MTTRITRSAPGRWAGPEYPTRCCFNADSTLLLSLDVDHFALYSVPSGQLVKDLPGLSASARPCWDPSNPNLIWFRGIGSTQLLTLDVETGEIATVHDFKELYDIGNGEGSISQEGRLPIVTPTRAFLYDTATGKEGTALPVSGRKIESMYAIGDRALLSWGTKGDGPYDGMRAYKSNMTRLDEDNAFKVASCNGHKDGMLDQDGTPVVIWCNSDAPEPQWKNAAVKTSLVTGEQTCLISFPWNVVFHVSCPDALPSGVNPYCIISTFIAQTDKGQILQVFLDGITPHVVLAETGYLWREQDIPNYAGASLAAINPAGTHIFYRSNKDNLDGPPNYCDGYLLTLGDQPSAASAPDTLVRPAPSIEDRVSKLENDVAELKLRGGIIG